jgi:hypothetical protein
MLIREKLFYYIIFIHYNYFHFIDKERKLIKNFLKIIKKKKN